ncbi:MAG TPA: phosphonate C-P lyase system protein PhnG [Dongiaceae bacterium]|nr:phosphonate C-P lyase system protein PhnG [Dongiaceae bacterium]
MGDAAEAGASEDIDGLAPEHAARRRWMSVLAKASAAELEQAIKAMREKLGELPRYRLIRRPEVGMTMVRARAGGTGRVFNLGEMTMTRCTLRTDDGLVGTSYVAGRSQRHAELAALIDALLQDSTRQAPLMALVIDPLARAQNLRRNRRVERSAPTRVDFFTVVRGEDSI